VSFVKLVTIDDSADLQVVRLEGLIGELRDGVPRLAEFGFASSPPEGSQGVAVAVGGSRENLVVVATEHRGSRRRNLPTGAAALYAAAGGTTECVVDAAGNASLLAHAVATLRGESAVVVQASSGAVAITAGASSIIVTDAGIQISAPTVTINGIDFSTHVHGGVQAGAGTSGVPE